MHTIFPRTAYRDIKEVGTAIRAAVAERSPGLTWLAAPTSTDSVTRPDRLTGFRHERHDGFALLVDSLEESTAGFAQSVVRGLSDHPRWLHCRYLYDAEGSDIFERISEQPEYYQTRTEAALLADARGRDPRARRRRRRWSSSAPAAPSKTRHLLDAWTARRPRARSTSRSTSAATMLRAVVRRARARAIRGSRCAASPASYERAFPLLRDLSPLVLVFLGSTHRQLQPAGARRLPRPRVGAASSPGDHLLLGIDLVKDVRTLEAAYNDARRLERRASRSNLFARMNRELGTDARPRRDRARRLLQRALDRIEIYARFTREAGDRAARARAPLPHRARAR